MFKATKASDEIHPTNSNLTKVAIVTDTHFGVRNDNLVFGKYINRFFREVFFPYIDKHKIKHVIHCGDIVDRRKMINFITARTMHVSFIKPCLDRGLDTTVLVGNHDVYFKDTNEVNALSELYAKRLGDNFRIIVNPNTIEIDGHAIDCYPWICKANEEDSLARMAEPKAKIALGHFELAGFEMTKGQLIDVGMDRAVLSKYALVGSGHLHEKSSKGNIHFFGCPYPITWADYESLRGFHVLDLDELQFDFVQNPLTVFRKVYYDDRKEDCLALAEAAGVRDCIVKLIVDHKEHPAIFEEFHAILDDQNPISITIQQDTTKFDHREVSVDGTEDTLTMIQKYAEVSEIENAKHKKMLGDLLTELYHTAMSTQEAA